MSSPHVAGAHIESGCCCIVARRHVPTLRLICYPPLSCRDRFFPDERYVTKDQSSDFEAIDIDNKNVDAGGGKIRVRREEQLPMPPDADARAWAVRRTGRGHLDTDLLTITHAVLQICA